MERQGRWSTVKIYLDSYIAASFWLHLLCLYLTGTILRSRNGKIRKGRLVTAALCCAGMDTAAIVALSMRGKPEASVLFLWISLLELILGAWIAYGKHGVLRNSLLVLAVTSLLAGVFLAVPVRNAGLFCLLGTVLLPLITNGATALLRAKQTQAAIYNVKLYQNEEEKCLSAFMDTGNRLRLYGSPLPVVLVDGSYLTEWIKAAEEKAPQRLVFLPYRGVGGKGILHGVRLHCELTLEEGKRLEGEVAAVAAEHRLFHGCGYQMLLQPEVLTMVCVKATQEGEKNVV